MNWRFISRKTRTGLIKLGTMALVALLVMALVPVLPAQAGGTGIPIPASSSVPDIINALEQGYAKLSQGQWSVLSEVYGALTTPSEDTVDSYVYSRLDSLKIGDQTYSLLAKFHEATGGQVTIDQQDIKALLDLARSLTSVRSTDLQDGKLSDSKQQEITDKLTYVKSRFADLIAWSGSSSPQGEFISFVGAVNADLVQRNVSPGALETPLIEAALGVLREPDAASTYKAVYTLAESVLEAANQVLGTNWTLATVSATNVENGLGALFLALDAAGGRRQGGPIPVYI